MSVIGHAAHQLRNAHILSPGLHSFRRREGWSPELRVRLEDPGSCPKNGTLLITLFDDSGSLSGPSGADPVSNRYTEARLAIEAVARRCSCGKELVSVIHFDSPTAADIAPRPISRRSLPRLINGLEAPTDGPGTSVLLPSLNLAHELAADHPNHAATLVVFSDFELFDADPALTLARLNEFPGQVHAVALRRTVPEGLLDSRIKVTNIRADDKPGAATQALFASLIAPRSRRRTRLAARSGARSRDGSSDAEHGPA